MQRIHQNRTFLRCKLLAFCASHGSFWEVWQALVARGGFEGRPPRAQGCEGAQIDKLLIRAASLFMILESYAEYSYFQPFHMGYV